MDSDFFVLPTNYIYEGQPVSIIEALAYKNVVISTNYRSIIDLIEHDKNGFLVGYNSPFEIYSTLRNLIENKDHAAKIQSYAYQSFKNNFTMSAHINNFVKLFKSL